jgi:hypothetical protein
VEPVLDRGGIIRAEWRVGVCLAKRGLPPDVQRDRNCFPAFKTGRLVNFRSVGGIRLDSVISTCFHVPMPCRTRSVNVAEEVAVSPGLIGPVVIGKAMKTGE